ncbi:MAG: proline--tRNA ligase [Chloroflexota bacterium]
MRFSNMFIPTMREDPSEATAVSHRLMLRAGYVRQLAAGLFVFLPLGWRVLNKINLILKSEMEAIAAQEITMPILHPAEIWQQTGRWSDIKEEMFRLKDRFGRDMCLGMTHEEIMTWLASREIRSYRELPQVWYQIQTKLRDEARPRGGVLRTREFVMKDSYSFDLNEDGLETNYRLHAEAYHRIFTRCGLKFYQVESDPGMMGGGLSHEFMAPSEAGEDEIVRCERCGYIANVEIALTVSRPASGEELHSEDVHTPEKRTVQEVSQFLGLDPSRFIKTLVVVSSSGPTLVALRGDQELHEKKLARLIGPFRVAEKEEVSSILGVEAGFIGPSGHSLPLFADLCIRNGTYVTGANKADYHRKGIRPAIDFKAQWHDLHAAREGDLCSKCGTSLNIEKVIEIGNIFKLGTKYSEPLKAKYLDRDGKEKPLVMGSYGIGTARVAAAAIEQSYDKDGIIWPKNIAPFDIQIIPLHMGDKVTVETAEHLYTQLSEIYNSASDGNIEVLLDDRDLRPGVKLKDADLLGIPVHVIIGEKGLREGKIEVKKRRGGEVTKVPADQAVPGIVAVLYDAE